MHSTTEFTHNGKTYEIRMVCDGESVYVKTFCENRPANPFRYSATIEAIHDMSQVIGLDVVKHLIETAKRDVVNALQ